MSRLDQLRASLSGYVADGAEADAVDAVCSLLALDDPFSRTHYDPGHITGSAFVLHPSSDAVALILHSKLGRWLQPGGHVEDGDATVAATAIREVREEIGVGPGSEPWLVDVDVHTFPARGDQPTHLHHDVRWAFRADSDLLVSGDGVDDVRWVPLGECLDLEESIARPARKLLVPRTD